MERREALKKMTLAMGGALSASTLTAVLTRCTSGKEYTHEGLLFLSDDQFRIVSAIADRIIPASGTPGALDAKVPEFIDMMLFDCYGQADKDKFLSGLKAFSVELDDDVADIEHDELEAFLTTYEKDVRKSKSRNEEAFFIRTVKELTLLGYFTSEPGATKALKYVAVPGRYDACIPLEDNVAWAASR